MTSDPPRVHPDICPKFAAGAEVLPPAFEPEPASAALRNQRSIFWASNLKTAPGANSLQLIEPAFNLQFVSESGGLAIVHLRSNDYRISLRFGHLHQWQTQFVSEQCPGNLDEAQIRDVVHDAANARVKKHHLHPVRTRGAAMFLVMSRLIFRNGGKRFLECARMTRTKLSAAILASRRPDRFLNGDGFHATEVDWAIAQKTGTARDVMDGGQYNSCPRGRSAPAWSNRNGDNRDAQKRAKVHRAGVIGE